MKIIIIIMVCLFNFSSTACADLWSKVEEIQNKNDIDFIQSYEKMLYSCQNAQSKQGRDLCINAKDLTFPTYKEAKERQKNKQNIR